MFCCRCFLSWQPWEDQSLILPETVFLSSKLYLPWVINKDQKAATLPGYFNSFENRKMPCVIYRQVTFNGTNYNQSLLWMWHSNHACSLLIHCPLQQKICHKATVTPLFSFTLKGSHFRLKPVLLYTWYCGSQPPPARTPHLAGALVPHLRPGTAGGDQESALKLAGIHWPVRAKVIN